TLGDSDSAQGDRRGDLPRGYDLGPRDATGVDIRLLEGIQVDRAGLELPQFTEADLGVVACGARFEPDLRQATLQRHLAAFEPKLVESTRAGVLALVAAAAGLSQARPDAATQPLARGLRTRCRFQIVQAHHTCSSHLTR